MISRLAVGLGLSLVFAVASAHAEVSVSREFMSNALDRAVDVQAGSYRIWPLPGSDEVIAYRITVAAENQLFKDISAFVVDDRNLDLFKAHARFNAVGKIKGQTPFGFVAKRQPSEQLYLVIDNSYSLLTTKKARISVTLIGELNEDHAQHLQQALEGFYKGFKQVFVLPDFDLHVAPCNAVNAFSQQDTGNITLCSEFWSQYANNPAIIMWTLFHELGHTALALWNIPGNDNEDIADEFATTFLLYDKTGPRVIRQAMEFFQGRNASAEAENMIKRGDRHSLSIQRIRNVQAWLEEPLRVTSKWNNLLYPHMTESNLRTITTHPGPYDNVQLATDELAKRAKLSGGSELHEPIVHSSLDCTKETDCEGDRICELGACVKRSNIDCITSTECGQGKSCRSRKGGGTECR